MSDRFGTTGECEECGSPTVRGECILASCDGRDTEEAGGR